MQKNSPKIIDFSQMDKIVSRLFLHPRKYATTYFLDRKQICFSFLVLKMRSLETVSHIFMIY